MSAQVIAGGGSPTAQSLTTGIFRLIPVQLIFLVVDRELFRVLIIDSIPLLAALQTRRKPIGRSEPWARFHVAIIDAVHHSSLQSYLFSPPF